MWNKLKKGRDRPIFLKKIVNLHVQWMEASMLDFLFQSEFFHLRLSLYGLQLERRLSSSTLVVVVVDGGG